MGKTGPWISQSPSEISFKLAPGCRPGFCEEPAASDLKSVGGLLHAGAEVLEHGTDGLPALSQDLVSQQIHLLPEGVDSFFSICFRVCLELLLAFTQGAGRGIQLTRHPGATGSHDFLGFRPDSVDGIPHHIVGLHHQFLDAERPAAGPAPH